LIFSYRTFAKQNQIVGNTLREASYMNYPYTRIRHSDLDITYPGLMYNIISIYWIFQLYLTYILILMPVKYVA